MGLSFEFDLEQQVDGGDVTYDCTVNGFLPYSITDDLCTDQANSPDPCPLKIGHHVDVGGIQAADGITKIKCTVNWALKDGTNILCAVAQWTVG